MAIQAVIHAGNPAPTATVNVLIGACCMEQWCAAFKHVLCMTQSVVYWLLHILCVLRSLFFVLYVLCGVWYDTYVSYGLLYAQ